MKVLFVIDTLEVGGAEKSMLEMLPFFRNVELVVCHVYCGDYLRAAYERAGVKVISLNVCGKFGIIEAVRKVTRVIRTEKPVIIHSALFRSGLVCRLIRRRTSIVHIGSFVNDSYVEVRYAGLNGFLRMKLWLVHLVDRLTARWCDHYVALTKTIAETNAGYLNLSRDKISVIYRGRDIFRFQSVSPVNINKTSFRFLNVARLIERKGQRQLIEAFAMLRDRHSNIELVLAGDGPLRQEYQNEIDKRGLSHCVQLLGTVDDIPALLCTADCFVMPSHFEGLGGAIIEAMLAARPVIVSDISVLTENVEEGVNGLTFPLRDTRQLASKMEWVLENRKASRDMGLRARERATERFDVQKIAEQYEGLYARLL